MSFNSLLQAQEKQEKQTKTKPRGSRHMSKNRNYQKSEICAQAEKISNLQTDKFESTNQISKENTSKPKFDHKIKKVPKSEILYCYYFFWPLLNN